MGPALAAGGSAFLLNTAFFRSLFSRAALSQ